MPATPPAVLDAYKLDHRPQYPKGSKKVVSNLTARGSRVKGVQHVVLFGPQYFVKNYLINMWNRDFFNRPKEEVIAKFARRINTFLGPDNTVGTEHIEQLHDLGYLPLKIMALPEGTHVPIRVPMLVFWNTHPDFFWLTNAIETILSTTLWLPCTSATTAFQYRQILEQWAEVTAPEAKDFVMWQGHDFSFRGHSSYESAVLSGAAHLLSFFGTDTVPAVDFLEDFYCADAEKEIIGGSVPATEHSVMCMGGKETEIETFRRLIEDVYPKGIVSIVSDTWDFWKVINPKGGFLVQLKEKIMKRPGKAVIRPDSGDPVKIVTGYKWIDLDVADIGIEEAYEKGYEAVRSEGKFYQIKADASGRIEVYAGREMQEVEVKGLIECLWEIFGGTESSTGYRILDSHIGGIYGDSITLDRAKAICERLAEKGFASVNLVYGIGSFTYQGAIERGAIVTRDTYGFAVKSTYGEVFNERTGAVEGIEISKDPVTDGGLKKSATGLTAVYRDDADPNKRFALQDRADWESVMNCALVPIFEDGKILKEYSLAEIRKTIVETAPHRPIQINE